MIRPSLIVVAILSVVLVMGCGSSDPDNDIITIRNFEFEPDELTVTVGTTVTWLNGESATHSVVSGTLDPTIITRSFNIDIEQTDFSTDLLTIDLGDTVIFRNVTDTPRQVEIRDLQDRLAFLSLELQRDQTAQFIPNSAGRYIVRDDITPTLQMTIDVVGVADPDGLFNSGVLSPGEKFEFTFTTPGQFRFFCGVHNIEQGVITVEP